MFLKIGFPIIAVLLGLCLVVIVCLAYKFEETCSERNICCAKLTTYLSITILIILFGVLFVMGILTRSKLTMAVGIPILILIFLILVAIVYLRVRQCFDKKDRNPRRPIEKQANQTELQQLKPRNNEVDGENSLPTYREATTA